MAVVNPEITLVTVCDNQYCVMLAALLKSIELNSTAAANITVYVVDDGVSKMNMEKLKGSVNGSLSLKFIDINNIIEDQSSLPSDSSSFPLNVYVRLFIAHFLPQTIEKAIYLDVDMIVKKDITDLWVTDMQEYTIAAVKDRSENIGSAWGGITNYRELGLDPSALYFNSGLLILNLKKWRRTNLTQEILKVISHNKVYAGFPDQYGLNVVFANRWLELDKRWNAFATGEIEDPFIIHFIGRKPIFSSYNLNEKYRKEFIYYLSFTNFKNYKLLGEHNRLIKKLRSLIFKKFISFMNLKKK
jgi:lipopolysaccharide biosynthesis glycosyltransferase